MTVEERNTPRVVFYGLTALNSTNEDLLQDITGTGRLGLHINPFISNVLRLNVGANLLNTGNKATKRDKMIDYMQTLLGLPMITYDQLKLAVSNLSFGAYVHSYFTPKLLDRTRVL